MLAKEGHRYRLGLAVDSAQPVDPSELIGPLTAQYPADVVSVAGAPGGAVAVIRWRAAGGSVDVGEVVETGMPGMPVPTDLAVHITVAGVEDLGDSGWDMHSFDTPVWRLAASAAVLGLTWYLTTRIGQGQGP